MLQVPKFLKFQLVKTKKNLQSFSDYRADWSKNRNGKTTMVINCNVFYECIKGNLGIFLLLAMSIGNDWMVDLMIVYIKKTIAKLWILTTL